MLLRATCTLKQRGGINMRRTTCHMKQESSCSGWSLSKLPARCTSGSGPRASRFSLAATTTSSAPDATCDAVRVRARLILNCKAAQQAFTSTVENTTSTVLGQVRIEMHLSRGAEQGSTTPGDLPPFPVSPIRPAGVARPVPKSPGGRNSSADAASQRGLAAARCGVRRQLSRSTT